MIVKISGKLVEKREQSLVVNVNGLFYDIIVPVPVINRVEDTLDEEGNVNLVIYHYFQLSQSAGLPILIGFINEIERDFFQAFIKVSGIGPKAAVRALNKPISEITLAIDKGDLKYLKTLSGIGLQRAKEIIAKLQGKVAKFGLIQDEMKEVYAPVETPDWHVEAIEVLLQLQYKKAEAENMIQKALERSKDISTTEELLNEIYKQKVKG